MLSNSMALASNAFSLLASSLNPVRDDLLGAGNLPVLGLFFMWAISWGICGGCLGVNTSGLKDPGVNSGGVNGAGVNSGGVNGVGANGVGVNGVGADGVGVNGVGADCVNGVGADDVGADCVNGVGLDPCKPANSCLSAASSSFRPWLKLGAPGVIPNKLNKGLTAC